MRTLIQCAISMMLIVAPKQLWAQQSIVAAGGSVFNENGSVSLSIGQTSIAYMETTQGSISEGVQQPLEIYVVTETQEPEFSNLQLITYPNPVQQCLFLSMKNQPKKEMTYRMYSTRGIIILSGAVVRNETLIYMDNLPAGIYFIEILDGKKSIKLFKIIKNQ